MIEATCTACGTVNRIADADVPIGAKFINCASCKSRVAIAGKAVVAVPAPARSDVPDIADLPAPRRASALGSEPAKPAPRSALSVADTHMEPELPAPRGGRISTSHTVPASAALELDELLAPPSAHLADLPAPRPKPPAPLADLPAPRPKPPAPLADLPAPRPKPLAPLADLPAPRPKPPAPLADLPAPRMKAPGPLAAPTPGPAVGRAMTDLPIPEATPRATAAVPPRLEDLPAPKAPASAGVIDLPAPRAAGPGATDLPAPRPKQPPGIADLPAPRRTPPVGIPTIAATKPVAPAMTLPTPAALKPPAPAPTPAALHASAEIVDLPGVIDLPTPSAGTDVAPKGFFDDLPGRPSTKPSTDVAPKGFFDDLPQPAKASPGTDVAPKGFFDDLPGRPTKPGTDVAPKGFFDDLPGRPSTKPSTDVAPKGFFDDLPQPAKVGPAPATPPAPAGSLELEPMDLSQPGFELDLEPSMDLAEPSIELDEAPATPARAKAPSVVPVPSPGPSSQFDDLDLSAPSPVRFETKPRSPGEPGAPPSSVATVRTPMAPLPPALATKGGDLALELEEPRGHAPMPTLGPKIAPTKPAKVADPAREKRRTKLVAIAAASVLALGGGGFYLYQRHAKAEAHAAAVADKLDAARRALAAGQWQRASRAAQETIELESGNAEALGIAAEALFAAGIHEAAPPKLAKARTTLAKALEKSARHPALERAKALSPIAAGQPDAALAKLQALAARAPADATLALYLGWAHAARGDHDAALAALDKAAAAAPVKVPALFARARVKQAKADLAGAQADFAAVLEIEKTNIPAQVGLAASLPAGKTPQQEADLLAILAIKDIEKREPRAATQAWALAADVARRSGKLDVARERYRKALAITPQDREALIGLGEVELRDGKLELAQDAIGKVLQQAPDHVRGQLAAVEIAIAQKHYSDAEARLQALAAKTPPPPAVEQARIKLLAAHLLEQKGQEDAAIAAYLDAARIAGDLDLTPTLRAAAKVSELAAKTADPARANELRIQAEQLLATLADNAKQDAQAAFTLGVAYLQAGDPTKAEPWLRQVTEQRPNDADAQHQLAKALAALGKPDDAIERLRKAMELDPARVDIGLELARTYEDTNREDDAARLYDKLVATADPPVVLRERAGRFYARHGAMAKAGAQGEKILAVNPDHPAGLYLKGEGLLAAGKTDDARKLFVIASDAGEAQYFDALGRAAEQWAAESGDTKYIETALRAYGQAIEKDASFKASLVGQGRLFVRRREDAKAIGPLAAAAKLGMTAEIGLLMGTAYKNLAQPKVALEWLLRANALEKTAETSWLLGQLYTESELNNPKATAGVLADATRLAEAEERAGDVTIPWLTDALHREGDVNRALGRDAEARRAWEKYLGRNPPPSARRKEVEHFLATSLRR